MSLVHGELVRFGFRHLFRSKKFWAAVAVSLIPVLAGFLLMATDASTAHRQGSDYRFQGGMTAWIGFFAMGGTVPLLALLMAGGLLADEAQDRTLSYLLVRPIRRSTLYISKFVPVATVLSGLIAVQVFLFGLLRYASLLLRDPGARETVVDGSTTVSSAGLIWLMIPVGIVGCVLVGLAYCALFAFVSMVVQRFHFMVNLLVFLVWELPFGSLGGAGLGFLTILFHGQSFVSRMDPTVDGLYDAAVHPVFAAFWLVGTVALWLGLGAWRIRDQDFHVTSAAT